MFPLYGAASLYLLWSKWVHKIQNKITMEVYSKGLSRAIGKILPLETGQNCINRERDYCKLAFVNKCRFCIKNLNNEQDSFD